MAEITHCELRYTCKNAWSDICSTCTYNYSSEYEEEFEDDEEEDEK